MDFLAKGTIITRAYYTSLVQNLWEAIKTKSCGILTKGFCLLQDNTPVHHSYIGQIDAGSWSYHIYTYRLYSPELAPPGYQLCIPQLQKTIREVYHSWWGFSQEINNCTFHSFLSMGSGPACARRYQWYHVTLLYIPWYICCVEKRPWLLLPREIDTQETLHIGSKQYRKCIFTNPILPYLE